MMRNGSDPTHRRWLAGALGAVLLGACASEKIGPEPPQLTSIAVSLASASIGIGQSQTLTGEARDQYGDAMPGISLTWASSSSSVATVENGVVTGVSAGTTSITASSGGVTSSPFALTVIVVTAGEIVIDKASVFLPAVGETAQLTAHIVNPQGVASPVTATWTSTAPGKVSIELSGQLEARAIGSAQIFAEAGGLRSAPTLVTVAEPQSGAVVVTDGQVVSVGPLNLAPGALPDMGTTYEVTLQGVAAPAPGTVMLGGETAPIAGKVVSSRQEAAGLVVTLELAPLHQLLRTYDISWVIDLAALPAEARPAPSARRTLSASWNAARRGTALGPAARLDDLEPFRAFKCDANIKAQLIDSPIQLSFANSLKLILDDRPGYSKHALEGSATLTGSAGLKLKIGFNASGRCDAQAQIRLPIFGWVSLLVMPAVRFGLGAEVKGEIQVAQGELGVEGQIGLSTVLGWECGGATPACQALETNDPINNFKTKSRIPRADGMQAIISGQFYALAGLDLSIAAGLANAEILEARVGPKQSFNLAFEDDQAARTDYAASYDLKLLGVVEPGGALKKAIKAVIDDDATGVSFKAEIVKDLSESPKGTLTVSAARARPDEPVDFRVDFKPGSVLYDLLGDNVTGVELYRRREDELAFTLWKSMDRNSTYGATYRWVPEEADAGKYEFAAFVNTQLLTPLLEVAPNSIQPLEVSCFSAGGSAVPSAVRHAASVCADTWIGTVTWIFKDNLNGLTADRTRTSITWTYDPTSSEPGVLAYKASGTFDLAKYDTRNGCTYSLSPSTFTITPSDFLARLTIFEGEEPSYTWSAGQKVAYTQTTMCPGWEAPVDTEFSDVLISIGNGSGPMVAGQTSLSGSNTTGNSETTWSFARP